MKYRVQAFDDVAGGRLRCGPFDAAACNFSLLGKESVESLIGALRGYLDGPRYLVIQTLHPLAACGDEPYRDGWRAGSWRGFSAEFNNPAPWYFRTLESWVAMLRRQNFDLLECREPTAPDAAAPASVIFVCKDGSRGAKPILGGEFVRILRILSMAACLAMSGCVVGTVIVC